MRIEADLDNIHAQRLHELIVKLNQPVAEILSTAIDQLYQRESPDANSQQAIVRRLRSRFAHLPAAVSLADELIAERRQEAMRENTL